MYFILKWGLFLLPPEQAHYFTLKTLKVIQSWRLYKPLPQSPVEVLGLTFPNPIGLAAGLDKNGDYIDALGCLGFGFIEVGTVTPKPQAGNLQPRLFRSLGGKALLNRMGFNNKGVDYLVKNLRKRQYSGIVGVNIGKNASTPLTHAHEDYIFCLEKVYTQADYVTINISSPNTQNLRSLQEGQLLHDLLTTITQKRTHLQKIHQKYVPILVKIAPDLTKNTAAEISKAVLASGIDGIIATNTTVERASTLPKRWLEEAGGVSGLPLKEKANFVLQVLRECLPANFPLIGVGGIMSPKDAQEKFFYGASLIQLYSGLIFNGPGLINGIFKDIEKGKNNV